MAKKLAVFVEGQTEQQFVTQLLIEVAGQRNLEVDLVQARGKDAARLVNIQAHSTTQAKYYILVCDCGTDNQVASDIRENFQGLVREGFSFVMGLRDVYPLQNSEILSIKKAITTILPKSPIPVRVVLAIRELEAWFLAEDTHFERIHADLTPQLVLSMLSLDTASIDVENVAHPSATLHQIYQLKGRAYRKKRAHVERTVQALDYARLYIDLPVRVPALAEMCTTLDDFFS